MNICEVHGCESPAEFVDNMDNKICEDCMEREIQEDEECFLEDYEALKDGENDTAKEIAAMIKSKLLQAGFPHNVVT